MGPISSFIEHHYRHFNAAALKDAARAYKAHIASGQKMMVTLAGAMSTAELGLSLAEMIRQGKVHAISCTGANLEEDIYNLIAHEFYERVPNYRNLSDEAEQALLDRHLNRVTDTCIPEGEAIRRLEGAIMQVWQEASDKGEGYFPHEYMYQIIRRGLLKQYYQIDPKNSWLVAACDKSGIDYMIYLCDYYIKNCGPTGIGFFQIGGGIAGDFPICVVPMIEQDMEKDVPKWSYFCQISDSTTSYGSYSGAVPNEKITWGKLAITTPRFIVESDASIVAPLMFAYILDQ